jgi:hypothetical protein
MMATSTEAAGNLSWSKDLSYLERPYAKTGEE